MYRLPLRIWPYSTVFRCRALERCTIACLPQNIELSMLCDVRSGLDRP